MLTQHEITPEEHAAWFDKASQDPGRRLMILDGGEAPIGFVQFTGVRSGGSADWGFYVSPEAPKGTGRKLGVAALQFAFASLGLHKVCGQALDFNQPSFRLHLALGFVEEGRLREQHVIDGTYHDLVCFGLLSREWKITEANFVGD